MDCSRRSRRAAISSSSRREKVPCPARGQELLAHVHQLHYGHGAAFDAVRQLQQRVFAAPGVVAAFERGRRGAEHDAGAGRLRAYDGHVAAVIAGVLFLLVAAIVLFIHYDEAQFAHRGEHARARTHHHAGGAGAYAPPMVGALGIGEGAVQNRHAVAEAREELPGHGGGESDFGHQQQRPPAGGESGFDGAQVHLCFAGARDAVKQERFEAAGDNGIANARKRGLLGWIEGVRRAHGARRRAREGLGSELHQPAARQSSRRRAGVPHQGLDLLQVVGTGVKVQEGQQFALGFGEAGGRGGLRQALDAQFFGGRPQRVALGLHLFHGDEALALERSQGLVGQRQFASEIRGGDGPSFQQPEDLDGGVVRRSVQDKLPCGIAAGRGKGIDFAAAYFRRQWQHAAQHFAERGAVVAGDPAAERQQFGSQHRLGIQQAHGVARGGRGRVVVAGQHHARQFSRAEGHHKPATRPHAVPQGFGQRVSKRLIERHGQADVAEAVGFHAKSQHNGSRTAGTALRLGLDPSLPPLRSISDSDIIINHVAGILREDYSGQGS